MHAAFASVVPCDRLHRSCSGHGVECAVKGMDHDGPTDRDPGCGDSRVHRVSCEGPGRPDCHRSGLRVRGQPHRDRRAPAAFGLEDRVRPEGGLAGSIPGPLCGHPGVPACGPGPHLGHRQGGVRAIPARALCGTSAAVPPAGVLAGPRVGPLPAGARAPGGRRGQGPRVCLERSGLLGARATGAGGLVRLLDRARLAGGSRHIQSLPHAEEGVCPGLRRAQGACVRDCAWRLCPDAQRPARGGRPVRTRVDGLRQAAPGPDLRCDGPGSAGAERGGRDLGRRMVSRPAPPGQAAEPVRPDLGSAHADRG